MEPWPQQRYARLIQEAAANPPFDQLWLWGILNQWQSGIVPLQQRKLSPGIPGQSVDNPPNRAVDLRATLIFHLPPKPAQVQYARFVQQAAIVGVDNPPFGRPLPWGSLGQWQARALTPIQQALLVQEFIAQAAPDNPPFGMPPDWLWTALNQWQIIPPTPTRYNKLVQEFVAVVVEKTPFNQGWFWAVWNQWPATAPIIQQRKLSPGIPGQSVDNPPSRALNFVTQVKAWEPAIATPQRQIYSPQPLVVVSADNPPFGMPPDWLYSVLTAAWKPGDPLPKQLLKILQAAPPAPVNNPPFGIPPHWLLSVLDQWWQPRQLTRMQVALLFQEGIIIPDNPPFGFRKIITITEHRIDVILG